MAPATNWLSFSLSPLEMLRSSESTQFLPFDSSSSVAPQYLIDNFYAQTSNSNTNTVWNNHSNNNNNNNNNNAKSQMLFGVGEEENQGSFVDLDQNNSVYPCNQTVPKLEDFLGECSQTETQESSLTQIYDQAVAGFQAFSGNSGSEVDDSNSAARLAAHSVESARSELAFIGGGRSLSLAVQTTSQTRNSPAEKSIVVVSDNGNNCSKNKISDTFGQRTSIYRGVTRHRWTGRYEAHLWDNSCRREGQARKGRQVYLGGYDKEDKAARAYDLAALKYWGLNATTNFPVSTYTKELEEMKTATKQEFIASLRRKSSGFSRGASIYRGVTRHHQQGRWQARIGRVAGNKDLYLGTFATEEEAAEAYDIAAIKFRGMNAVTNFEMNRYDVEAISKSALPVGGAAKRLKLSLESSSSPCIVKQTTSIATVNNNEVNTNNIDFSSNIVPCGIPYDAAFYQQSYYHHQQQQQQQQQHYQLQNYLANSEGSVGASTAGGSVVVSAPEFYIWPHQSY